MQQRLNHAIAAALLACASCGGDEILARAQASVAVTRLPTGVKSDSVFALMRGQEVTFDQSRQSDRGVARLVDWKGGLRVAFLDDTLVKTEIRDLTK